MRFSAPCEQPQDGVVGKAGHDVKGFGRSGRERYPGNCNAGLGPVSEFAIGVGSWTFAWDLELGTWDLTCSHP